MAAEYPGTVPTIASNKADATVTATDHPAHHNKLAEETVAIATELGTLPKGSAATVKARLDAGEAATLSGTGFLYVDATDGNDSNAGRGKGAGRAKLTLAGAISALPAAGGVIELAPGTYTSASQINLQDEVNIEIRGGSQVRDIAGGTGTASTILNFTGNPGATAGHINLKGAKSVTLRNLVVLNSHASFAGYLVDAQNSAGTGATDTSKVTFDNVSFFGGAASRLPAAAVYLRNSHTIKFQSCSFYDCQVGALGRTLNTEYAINIDFDKCFFQNNVVAHVKNAGCGIASYGGAGWRFSSCVFEPIVGSVAGAYKHDAGVKAHILSFDNCWFGDATSGTGTQIAFSGFCLNVTGCRLGSEAVGARIIVIDENATENVWVVNNHCVGDPGTPCPMVIDFGSTTGHGALFASNYKEGVTAEYGGAAIPITALEHTKFGFIFGGQVAAYVGGTNILEFGGHTRTAAGKNVYAGNGVSFPTAIAPASVGAVATLYRHTDERLWYNNASDVDSPLEAVGVRLPARVAPPGNVNTASPGATFDGVTMVVGDRALLPNQTTPSQNGLWIWNGAAVAMTRAPDADTAVKLTDSLMVQVDEGTANRNTQWMLTTDKPITLGTTALRFTRISPDYTVSSHPPSSAYQPVNSKLENLPRDTVPLVNQATLTTQIIRVFPMGVLRAGDTLTNINLQVGTTASASITNSWAGIARLSDRVILAISATSTATTAANTKKTFPFAASFTADKDEVLIGFVMYQATTVPSLFGINHGNVSIISEVPIVNGTSNTGQTTPLSVGAALTAFTADTEMIYAFCE